MEGRWIAESSSSKDVCCSAGSSLATTSPVKPSNEYVLVRVLDLSFLLLFAFSFSYASEAASNVPENSYQPFCRMLLSFRSSALPCFNSSLP